LHLQKGPRACLTLKSTQRAPPGDGEERGKGQAIIATKGPAWRGETLTCDREETQGLTRRQGGPPKGTGALPPAPLWVRRRNPRRKRRTLDGGKAGLCLIKNGKDFGK